MFDGKIIYRILRYLILGVLLYIILRYTPMVEMNISDALTFAILLSVLSIAFEYFCKYSKNNNNNNNNNIINAIENFQSNCDDCTSKCKRLHNDNNKVNNNLQHYWGNIYDNICEDEKYGFGDMFEDNYPYTGNSNNKTSIIWKNKTQLNNQCVVVPIYANGAPMDVTEF